MKKELLQSFYGTFFSTLLPIVGGITAGVLIAQGLIFIAHKFGINVTIAVLLISIFLFAWIMNAISDYRIKKAHERIEKEYQEFRNKLEGIKTK